MAPQEAETAVRLLRQCAWGLVSDALQHAARHPDDDLVLQIHFASNLHFEPAAGGRTPDTGFVRRLAVLVLHLLDRRESRGESQSTLAESVPGGRPT
ncbi:hypothetical protein ACIG3E_23280 [Streptomyces sp. NPDC053474]|uniref:hypothetical protein n=1 Tax=Streptomyces sp. NPDC053474 TaxID=3365704 RepID=UPI0037D1DE09